MSANIASAAATRRLSSTQSRVVRASATVAGIGLAVCAVAVGLGVLVIEVIAEEYL